MMFFSIGVKQHDIVPRSLKKIYANKDFKKAELELQQAAEVGDHNPGAAQTVRAGKLIRFFDEDKENKHLDLAIMLISSLQYVLNVTFKAESKMRAYLEALSDESSEAPTPEVAQAKILALEREARMMNVRVLSGDAAWEALASMTAKLEDFEGTS